MDFVWKLYGNTYAVHVTVALVGVATLNLALPSPPACMCYRYSALFLMNVILGTQKVDGARLFQATVASTYL